MANKGKTDFKKRSKGREYFPLEEKFDFSFIKRTHSSMSETSDHEGYRSILKASLERNYLKNENNTNFSMGDFR